MFRIILTLFQPVYKIFTHFLPRLSNPINYYDCIEHILAGVWRGKNVQC